MKIPRFELERFFAEHEFNVEHFLCGSDCESVSIDEVLDLEPDATEWFRALRLGYTESQGRSSLRQVIADTYEATGPDRVLVCAGAEEGIFLFMHAALAAGDHVVVHWPCYQSLFEIARSIGCEVSRWEAREADGWSLDVEELAELIRPNTQAIVLNTPHNPTGYLMSSRDYEEVHRIARERGVLLFSDEVYRESEYDRAERLPAACDLGEHAVSLGVLSKTYGLPGLRIGWIATRNERILRRIGELKDYTTICTSAPSEFLAEVALRHREKLIERNLGIIARNLEVLDRFLARQADRIRWVRPRAGAIAFPRLLSGEIDAFSETLRRDAGVLLLPGSVFADRGNHFRIGFGRESFPTAIERFETFLAASGVSR
jgi:aspartate/methionine/tyrosine aminotransferase